MNNSNNKILLWLSFFYLVSFSMAIPVMYESAIELHAVFHILEAITAIVLVFIFTYLFLQIFKGIDDLFLLIPIIVATILDVILIIMRWNETINTFVLIFISLSIILFIIGYIFKKVKKNNA